MVKNILFVVTTIKSNSAGLGGHYWSLAETAKTLSKVINVQILILGDIKSPVFDNSSINVHFEKVTRRHILNSKRLRELVCRYESVDIVHAFDRFAVYFASRIARRIESGLAYTQCGGKIKGFFPYVPNTIVFSHEGFAFLREKYKSFENLLLVPNRVGEFELNLARVKILRQRLSLDWSKITAIRISRIGPYYFDELKSIIGVVRWLSNKGTSANLVILGTVECVETKELILKLIRAYELTDCVALVTEEEFTKNAKVCLSIADIVIGSGRSLMEASLIGLPVLFPTIDKGFIPLTKKTYKSGLKFNFSNRTIIGDNIVYPSLMEIFTSKNVRENCGLEAKEIGASHFLSDGLLPHYMSMYKDIKKISFFDNLRSRITLKLLVYRSVYFR